VELELLGLGALLPAALVAAILVATETPWRERPLVPGGAAAPVALALAFVAAYLGVYGSRPPVPPTGAMDAAHWTVYLALAGGVWGAVESLVESGTEAPDSSPRPGWTALRWLTRLALCGGLAIVLLRAKLDHPSAPWTGATALLRVSGAAALALIIWTALDRAERNEAGPAVPAAVLAAAGLTLGLLAATRSARLALPNLGLAAGAAILGAHAWWRPGRRQVLAPVAALTLSGLLVCGVAYSRTHPVAAALAALAPGAALVTVAVKAWSPLRAAALAAACAGLLGGAGLGLGVALLPPDDPSPYTGEGSLDPDALDDGFYLPYDDEPADQPADDAPDYTSIYQDLADEARPSEPQPDAPPDDGTYLPYDDEPAAGDADDGGAGSLYEAYSAPDEAATKSQ
jgi:hypothetical protein